MIESRSVARKSRFFPVLTVFLLSATVVRVTYGGDDIATRSSVGFYHPGVLVNRAQLEFVKNKVVANQEPWKSAFQAAKSSEFGSLSYTPKPRETVECGPFS